jgi:5'(3')-deoxyribonucleotidase
MAHLYLDCDGVLADFENGAKAVLGETPDTFILKHGREAFWRRLAGAGNFFGALPVLPDARRLFDAVRHLRPTILTGCPRGDWAASQKVRWAEEHFPGTPVITCMAADKRQFCRPGDILVDDLLTHRHLWEGAGGVFVHHRTADRSIKEVQRLRLERQAA